MTTTLNIASIKPSLDKLQALERELAASLIERDEVIRASLVALLARQHLVVLGPPGTAKSALVTSLAGRIGPQNGAGLRNFAYLMSRFTTPEELFGPVSVSGLKRDEYRRITAGKLVEAELVFLDEIFKASSAILNALLNIVNERVFHNGDQEMKVPLISLFGPEGIADLQWLKKHVDTRTLPNGWCGIPIALGPCPHPNACLTCPHFRTDRTHLATHEKQLSETVKIIQISQERGWTVQAENNEQVATNLRNICNGPVKLDTKLLFESVSHNDRSDH